MLFLLERFRSALPPPHDVYLRVFGYSAKTTHYLLTVHIIYLASWLLLLLFLWWLFASIRPACIMCLEFFFHVTFSLRSVLRILFSIYMARTRSFVAFFFLSAIIRQYWSLGSLFTSTLHSSLSHHLTSIRNRFSSAPSDTRLSAAIWCEPFIVQHIVSALRPRQRYLVCSVLVIAAYRNSWFIQIQNTIKTMGFCGERFCGLPSHTHTAPTDIFGKYFGDGELKQLECPDIRALWIGLDKRNQAATIDLIMVQTFSYQFGAIDAFIEHCEKKS